MPTLDFMGNKYQNMQLFDFNLRPSMLVKNAYKALGMLQNMFPVLLDVLTAHNIYHSLIKL